MSTNRRDGEQALLEKYRIALTNAKEQPIISKSLAAHGYGDAMISEGVSLYNLTMKFYNFNKREDEETDHAFEKFDNLRDALAETYSEHRKKAKITFDIEPLILKELDLRDAMPETYLEWMVTVKKFYSKFSESTQLQARIATLGVTSDVLKKLHADVIEVEYLRAQYVREDGESQNATQKKNIVFLQFDEWMSKFYKIARIALKDQPQLLEALGILVRN